MRFFNNKLSRINFLILVGILTYLFADMSNSNGYVSAISKASPSVINITARENTNKLLRNGRSYEGAIGSGIIISDDGYIITNLHLINGKEVVEVELDDGQVYTATVVGYDQRSDLAVTLPASLNLNLVTTFCSNSKSNVVFRDLCQCQT